MGDEYQKVFGKRDCCDCAYLVRRWKKKFYKGRHGAVHIRRRNHLRKAVIWSANRPMVVSIVRCETAHGDFNNNVRKQGWWTSGPRPLFQDQVLKCVRRGVPAYHVSRMRRLKSSAKKKRDTQWAAWRRSGPVVMRTTNIVRSALLQTQRQRTGQRGDVQVVSARRFAFNSYIQDERAKLDVEISPC